MCAAILCLGCGEDVTFKANNRRNLCSDSSTSVFDTWKKMFMEKLTPELQDEYLIPNLVEKHRMCRACFSSIERLSKLRQSVEMNLSDAIDAILPPPVHRKRQAGNPINLPKPKRPPTRVFTSESEQSSVAVSILLY